VPANRITGKTFKAHEDLPVISRRVLMALLGGACVLPVCVAVVLGVARLLAAMQDTAGAAVLDRIALAAGIVWAIALICLVIALALNSLDGGGDK
jgi:hypothetical protein